MLRQCFVRQSRSRTSCSGRLLRLACKVRMARLRGGAAQWPRTLWASSSGSPRSPALLAAAVAEGDIGQLPGATRVGTRPRVCILGGGFGGLYTAIRLESLMWPQDAKPQVTLIDQATRFVFKPLLYELLNEGAQPWEVAPEFNTLLGPYPVKFIQARVTAVQPREGVAGGTVSLDDGSTVEYDWLVLALGSEANMALAPGAKQHALPFCTYEDAVAVQQEVQRVQDRGDGRVVVVGAGFSGVELAVTLAERLQDRAAVELVAYDNDIILGADTAQADAARSALASTGVKLGLGAKVTKVREAAAPPAGKVVELEDRATGERRSIRSDLVLWTAGVQPATSETSTSGKDLGTSFPFPRDRRGLTQTDETLRVLNNPRVFAVGDIVQPQGHIFPATAQVAFQQADYVAWNIWAGINGRPLLPFKYQHLGTMMSLGKTSGSAALNVPLDASAKDLLAGGPLGPVMGALGIDVSSSGNLAVAGPLAAVLRKAAYWYRQPTDQHRLRVGASWLRIAVQDVQGMVGSALSNAGSQRKS